MLLLIIFLFDLLLNAVFTLLRAPTTPPPLREPKGALGSLREPKGALGSQREPPPPLLRQGLRQGLRQLLCY